MKQHRFIVTQEYLVPENTTTPNSANVIKRVLQADSDEKSRYMPFITATILSVEDLGPVTTIRETAN